MARIGEGLPRSWKWRSPRALTLSQFSRNASGLVGLTILIVMGTLTLGAPLFTDFDPGEVNVKEILLPPTWEHPLGTDNFGRDLFSRVLYGGRVSLLVGTVVTAVTALTGVFLGALSGYFPRLDGPFMRVMDVVMAFPSLILAIASVATLGPRLENVIIALSIPMTPRTARVVRSQVLLFKEQLFVTAAQSVGAGHVRIILRHILPNAFPIVLVRQTYVFGIALLSEGALSFLGVGVPPEIPTLGAIVAEGRGFLRVAPWWSLGAASAIALMVLGVNLLGDGLRDVLDPRMKE